MFRSARGTCKMFSGSIDLIESNLVVFWITLLGCLSFHWQNFCRKVDVDCSVLSRFSTITNLVYPLLGPKDFWEELAAAAFKRCLRMVFKRTHVQKVSFDRQEPKVIPWFVSLQVFYH